MWIMQTSIDLVADIVHISSDDKNQDKYNHQRIKNFVICGSCHWYASCLKLDRLVTTCPICSDSRLEFMPLTEKEAYTFERDAKRRIIFKFHSRSQKSLGGSS